MKAKDHARRRRTRRASSEPHAQVATLAAKLSRTGDLAGAHRAMQIAERLAKLEETTRRRQRDLDYQHEKLEAEALRKPSRTRQA